MPSLTAPPDTFARLDVVRTLSTPALALLHVLTKLSRHLWVNSNGLLSLHPPRVQLDIDVF